MVVVASHIHGVEPTHSVRWCAKKHILCAISCIDKKLQCEYRWTNECFSAVTADETTYYEEVLPLYQ